MKLLLDTHILLWAADASRQLPGTAKHLIEDPRNELFFSAASIWEVVIKSALRRPDFKADPVKLRDELRANGYAELSVSSPHALAVQSLPPIHKDPFDRILIAQAHVHGATLVTADETVGRYPGNIMVV